MKRIMVVEDEALVATDIKISLKDMGYTVTSLASSGREAIKDAAKDKPDLILMDIQLEGEMDGIEAADEIRSNQDIPVVFLTAYADDKTLTRAKIAEPFGYIIKPFNDRELHTTIEMALYKHDADSQIKESEEKYRTLFETASDAIFVIEMETGRIIDCNQVAAERLGYLKEELLDLKVFDINPPTAPEEIKERFKRQMAGEKITFETNHKRKDGTWMAVEVTSGIIDYKGEKVFQSMARDITQRKKIENALKESEDHLRTIIETEPECVKILDSEGILLDMNPAGLAMIEADSLDEVKGQCIYPLVTVEYRDAFKDLTKRVCHGESGMLEFKAIGLKGNPIWLETHAVPFEDRETKNTLLLAVTRDTTERKHAYEEIKLFTAQLDEANRLKDLFTDIMRHDVMNPLQITRMFADNLSEDVENLPEDMVVSIDVIKENTERAISLVDMAATYAKVDSLDGLDMEYLELGPIMERSIERLGPIIESRKINVEYKETGLAPIKGNMIIADIFANLLTNAIKFSPEGSTVKTGIEDEGKRKVRVFVKDNGTGIKDEFKETIFERFQRGDKGGIEGSGLGLAISKRITELHGGKIWVEDNPEGGSIFYVSFPRTD